LGISEDATLGRSIQRSVEKQSKLLNGIGTAKMETRKTKTVLKIANKQADKLKSVESNRQRKVKAIL
jgi:hypothetical protein